MKVEAILFGTLETDSKVLDFERVEAQVVKLLIMTLAYSSIVNYFTDNS
jgi:hypothetical protein